jgi:hypothetical protein
LQTRFRAQALDLGRECSLAVVSLVNILPDDMTASDIDRQIPWWSSLHYLCRVMAVFILELSL